MRNKYNLFFHPVSQLLYSGGERQIHETTCKGMCLVWITFFPNNPFKKIENFYLIEELLPLGTKVPKGEVREYFYSPDGYGYPFFRKLEYALDYIDKLQENETEKTETK